MENITFLIGCIWGFVMCPITVFIYLIFKNKRQKTIKIPETLDAQDALHILVQQLFNTSYYITDPVGCKQANAIMVRDIIKHCTSKKVEIVHEEATDDA
jgi:hypothetical protein